MDRQQEGILVIGKDVWTREEVVNDLRLGNFQAAHNLSKIAAKLQVDSLDQLVSRFTMEDLFAEHGFGTTTMVVLMSAQEAKRKDPLKWIHRKADEIVTLSTEKQRVLKNQKEHDAAQRAARNREARHAAARN